MLQKKILCIDSAQNYLDLLTFNLEASGYSVETNNTGQNVISTDVNAFDLGAVDYIIKPFSIRELLARIRAVLRRYDNYPVDELIRVGPITIDSDNYEAFRNQAFSKLKTFQSSDGGIQWFQGMKSNDMLTLYLLEKLGQLRSVGAFTPDDDERKVIDKALSYVDERIAVQGSYKEFRPYGLIRDFAIRSLWFDEPMSQAAQAVYKRFVDGTEDGWQKISILEKAQLCNLMLRAAKTPYTDKRFDKRIKLLRESLKDYAVENPTVGCYFPNAVMPFRGLMNNEIYAHAQLIETFGALGERKVVDGIAQWLLLQKHNQAWENTVATTDAVHALISSKAKDLKLGAVYYTYTTKLDRVKASANELSVTRTFVRADTGAPLQEGEALHVGDAILATYSIHNTENRSFVQMRAMRPACFYPKDERSYFS